MNNSALIVIDVQNGLLTNLEQLHDPSGVVARISALVDRARAAAVPVVFIQHDGGAGHPLEKPHDGWQISSATGYRPGDIVVEKRHCDAFHETVLADELERLAVKRLVLAGMCSDYCVDTTCRRAFSLGYEVVLANDAHTTFSRPKLSAQLIVEHHNEILGSDFATSLPGNDIAFQIQEACS